MFVHIGGKVAWIDLFSQICEATERWGKKIREMGLERKETPSTWPCLTLTKIWCSQWIEDHIPENEPKNQNTICLATWQKQSETSAAPWFSVLHCWALHSSVHHHAELLWPSYSAVLLPARCSSGATDESIRGQAVSVCVSPGGGLYALMMSAAVTLKDEFISHLFFPI